MGRHYLAMLVCIAGIALLPQSSVWQWIAAVGLIINAACWLDYLDERVRL
jgi:hypothetical protein